MRVEWEDLGWIVVGRILKAEKGKCEVKKFEKLEGMPRKTIWGKVGEVKKTVNLGKVWVGWEIKGWNLVANKSKNWNHKVR